MRKEPSPRCSGKRNKDLVFPEALLGTNQNARYMILFNLPQTGKYNFYSYTKEETEAHRHQMTQID